MNEENENFNEKNLNTDETSTRREKNKIIVQELKKRLKWYIVKMIMTFILLIVFLFSNRFLNDYLSPALSFAYAEFFGDVFIYVVIAFVVLFIYFLIRAGSDSDEIYKYCPYCYEKDFKRTTLEEWIVRAYNTSEKRGTKTIGKGDNSRVVDNMVPVRVEDWKGTYRNECCGRVYDKEWQHKIDL